MARVEADDRRFLRRQRVPEPHRERPGLHAHPLDRARPPREPRRDRVRAGRRLALCEDRPAGVADADRSLLLRDVQSRKHARVILHRAGSGSGRRRPVNIDRELGAHEPAAAVTAPSGVASGAPTVAPEEEPEEERAPSSASSISSAVSMASSMAVATGTIGRGGVARFTQTPRTTPSPARDHRWPSGSASSGDEGFLRAVAEAVVRIIMVGAKRRDAEGPIGAGRALGARPRGSPGPRRLPRQDARAAARPAEPRGAERCAPGPASRACLVPRKPVEKAPVALAIVTRTDGGPWRAPGGLDRRGAHPQGRRPGAGHAWAASRSPRSPSSVSAMALGPMAAHGSPSKSGWAPFPRAPWRASGPVSGSTRRTSRCAGAALAIGLEPMAPRWLAVSAAAMVAVGGSTDGRREPKLRAQARDRGPAHRALGGRDASRSALPKALVERGPEGTKPVISDAHEGLRAAIARTLTGATWQRCREGSSKNSPDADSIVSAATCGGWHDRQPDPQPARVLRVRLASRPRPRRSHRDLVPDDHVLARVDRVLDLGWLRAEVADLCAPGVGRPGIDPEAAVRLMLAGLPRSASCMTAR